MHLGRVAVLLVATLAVGCQAELSPTVPTRPMTVTIPIPFAGRAVVDAADRVFAKRLKALGITQALVATTDDSMRYSMQVPLAIDDEVIEAVLHRAGLFQFVPWPAGQAGPAPGDRVPDDLQPLFDDPAEFQSAEVITDTAGQSGVDFTFGPVGTEAISTYTRQHIGSSLPFVLDGFVLTAPIIQGPIDGGPIRLTGPDLSPIPLAAIAAMIASGPLPESWR